MARHCFWHSLPSARSGILSATLFSLVTFESLFIRMLTSHRPTMSPAAFVVGSIEYSLCNFTQFSNFRIPFGTYTHLSSLPCCTQGVERKEQLYSRNWRLMEVPLQFRGDRIELLHSPACPKRRLMEEGAWWGYAFSGENLRPKNRLGWHRQEMWLGPAGTLRNHHDKQLNSALTTFKWLCSPCRVGVSIAPFYPTACRRRRIKGGNSFAVSCTLKLRIKWSWRLNGSLVASLSLQHITFAWISSRRGQMG